MPILPTVPETVTVHLGQPSSDAQNVTVSFPDYIKNVASSEIYPTWPEAAIRANIYAQISYTLNRIYTRYYPSRGFDFDITNSTAFDQSFVYGRDIFENISRIVDEIFNSYLRRRGSVEPLFAAYCDGVRVSCDGLSQWGSVSLAEEGLTPYEILTTYYGDDIDIVTDVPVGDAPDAPLIPLREGQIGPNVELLQRRLNRISANYPAIPKIYPINGVFDTSTTEAVKEFQRVFDLSPDGVVGPATWYRILYIYNGIKRLSELNSEGLTLGEISTQYPNLLQNGSEGAGVLVLQYYLSYISAFIPTVPAVALDGYFGASTEAAVRAFQSTYGLAQDGIVGEQTWRELTDVYQGLVASVPIRFAEGVALPFPGEALAIGSQGEEVRIIQEYLNYIGETYNEIPPVNPDGVYGPATRDAVRAFQRLFNVPSQEGVVGGITWVAIASIYEDLYEGHRAEEGQYPGYPIGGAS
ncbi:MAG: spore cortex-lytic protein [Ruminococcaceae bacterium]|nr:spore cortex-lytic protein [Oscillospiraceae bacterium]